MNERAQEEPDLLISIAADLPEEAVSDLLREADDAGLATFFERREPEVFAAVEWYIPTAIMLFLGRKFIDPFAEEAAKDLYPAVKAAILRVIRRSSGPNRPLNPRYVSSAPLKVPPGPVAVLEVLVAGPDGLVLRFRFPAELPDDLHMAALEGLASTALRVNIEDLIGLDAGRHRPVIFTFESADVAWKQVDLLAEARAAQQRSRAPHD